MKYRRLLSAIAALSVLLFPTLAGAQNNPSGGQGLEISPPLIELSANPGETKTIDILVRNVTSQTLIVKGQVNDFVAAGEEGVPKLLLDESEQSPYSIKNWIKNLPSISIASTERKALTVTMQVPKEASPGGHYGVVRFTGTPPELEDTGVSLSASVGTLLLINVSGQVTEQANITELYTSQNNKKRGLFEYGPITLTAKVENQGSVHIKPKGTIRITDMLGKETASFQFNEKGNNVLPASTRKFEQALNKKFMFGRYKVIADIVYGSENKIISRSTTFWVIPYKLIVFVIVAILLIIFLIKRYNRYILHRAQKKHGGAPHANKKNKT